MKIYWLTMSNLRDVIHSTYRLTVWNDFSVELVHGHEGRGIRVELDEAVGRLLTGELVSNELTEQKQMLHNCDLNTVPLKNHYASE